MMSTPPTLFTYALSPYGMKVYWALIHKRISFNLTYVSPDQSEIAFTRQTVVPVLQVGDAWKLDSGPICRWLDDLHPHTRIAGDGLEEQQAIEDADAWVTNNVIGLSFRSFIEDDTRLSAFRNGRKLANAMRSTSGGVPWWMQFVWVHVLRRTAFVRNDAGRTDMTVSLAEFRQAMVRTIEQMISPSGYLAGTPGPSYADIALFAQMVGNATLGFEGGVRPDSSPALGEYYAAMCQQFDLSGMPDLIPGWRPVGL